MKRPYGVPELNRGRDRTAQVLIALLLALCVWAGVHERAAAAPVVQQTTGVVTNTVRVGSTTFDPNLANNTAQQVTTVHAAADLQISKGDGITSVVPGATITYTVVVTNAGPSAARGVTVQDFLPAGLAGATWQCTTTVGSSCAVAAGTGDIDTTLDLRVAGQATFTLTAHVALTVTADLTNTATVTGTTDPTPANNQATDHDKVLLSTLTGTVFLDHDGNGNAANGEGLAEVTVVITTSVGTTLLVTTDSAGHFTATVPPGTTLVDVDNADLPLTVTQHVGSDPSMVNVPAGGVAQDHNGYRLPTPTPTVTPTSPATSTPIAFATPTASATATSVITATPTASAMPTATTMPESTATAMATATATFTFTATVLPTATMTPEPTATVMATATVLPEPRGTAIVTSTATAVPTVTPSPEPTTTATVLPEPTATAMATVTFTATVVPTATPSPEPITTAMATATATATFTSTAVPTATAPPEPTATATATVLPEPTATATAAATFTATADPTTTPTATATATSTPTNTATPTATATATTTPTASATPSPTVTATATATPTSTPSATSTPAGAVGDFVWFDRNGNGVQEGDESGLANVTVVLYRADGQLVGETTTDVNGFYRFSGLPTGDYYLQVVTPQQPGITLRLSPVDQGEQSGGGVLDSDVNQSTGQSAVFRLADGQTDLNWDVGFYGALQLGNLVWHDRNNNGLVDAGEPGLPDITVQLFRAADDPLVATPLASTVTDAAGGYRFVDLPLGQYQLYLPMPPTAYGVSSMPTDSADNGEDNDDNGIQDLAGGPVRSPLITLGLYSESTTDGDDANSDESVDFGFFAYAALGDRVWYDQNRDGIQEASELSAGEAGAPFSTAGVAVTLYAATTNTVVATTTTDSGGYYQFTGLVPGSYYLHFDLPPDYQATLANALPADELLDSDADPMTLNTPVITLTSGDNNSNVDLGVRIADDRQTAALGDRVWLDLNGNGVQESGEAGVGGVTLTLYHADGSLAATTVTDRSGGYLLTNLAPGNYYLTVTPPAGYSLAPPNQGDPAVMDALDSDVDLASGRSDLLALAIGQYDDRWDVGLVAPATASLTGYVWLDHDLDGLQGTAEAPVPGVTMALYYSDGTLVGTTVTDANGHYNFTNLPPGDYYLLFTAPAGFTGTLNDQGGDDTHDSDVITDPDGLTGRTPLIILAPGENQSSWDYGLHSTVPASLGNRVWLDANEDGLQDPSEPGVAGITLRLYNTQGELIRETVSDPNGLYGFADLPAGSYILAAVLPEGYLFSIQSFTPGSDIDSDVDAATGRSPPIVLFLGSADQTWDVGLHRRPTVLEQGAEPDKVRIFLPLVSRTGLKIKERKLIERQPILQCGFHACLQP